MDTLTTVLNLIQVGDQEISIDLRDAYLHIKFKNISAIIFKTNFPVCISMLRSNISSTNFHQNHRCSSSISKEMVNSSSYIFGRLVSSESNCSGVNFSRKRILETLLDLGFIINLSKSNLVPTHVLQYIATIFHFHRGLVFPTPERDIYQVSNTLHTHQTHRPELSTFTGVDCLFPTACIRLFMRPFRLHLQKHWQASTDSLEKIISYSFANNLHHNIQIHHGCFSERLGRSHEWSDSTGQMESRAEYTAYKLFRDDSSNIIPETLPFKSERESCFDSLGQSVCSSIFEQTGWNQVIATSIGIYGI